MLCGKSNETYKKKFFFFIVADAHGPHKSTVCRAVKRVTFAINDRLFRSVICWPQDAASLRDVRLKFFDKAGIPCVGGLVDGTLINIQRPAENEAHFVD